jgi:hypothetical protein
MSWVLGASGSLSDIGLISNVTSATWVKGDILVYNGTSWVDLAVGADTEILTADSAEATGIKWATGGSVFAVVDDTTPQLGGTLDLNSQLIQGGGNTVIDYDSGAGAGTATWDTTNRPTASSLAGGNLAVSVTDTAWASGIAHGDLAMSSGKWYWELTITTIQSSTYQLHGIAADGVLTYDSQYPGQVANSYGCQSNGTLYGTGKSGTAQTFAIANDVVMFAYDADTGKLYQGVNGTWSNSGSPGAGTGAIFTGIAAAMIPAYGAYASGTDTITANFGGSAFSYTEPSGYTALDQIGSATFTLGDVGLATVIDGSSITFGTDPSLGIGNLSDVTITAVASGELIKWNGTAWINNTLAEAGVAAASHTHVEADITDLQSYLLNIVEDTSPQLGGALDVNGQTIDFADNETIRFGTGNDATMSFDGTDMNITGVTATNLNISNGFVSVDCDANMFVRNAHAVRVYDASNDDFIVFTHNGANGVIDTAGTGTPGHLELRPETRVGGDGTHGKFQVMDADHSDYLDISADGTDINFTITGGGVMDFADHTVRDLVLEDLGYTSTSEVVSANAFTITVSEGPAFQVDLEAATAAVTGTISGGPTSGDYGVISVKVEQDSTTAQTLTWAGGTMRWAGGSAHPVTTTVGGFTVYTFETWDGGTIWYGTGADYS